MLLIVVKDLQVILVDAQNSQAREIIQAINVKFLLTGIPN